MATLLELRDGAKDLADLADSEFVSNARWNAWVNQGMKRLFGLVATAFADHFFEEDDFALTSTANGARTALPDRFWYARGVDKDPDQANAVEVRRYNWSERNRQDSGYGPRWHPVVRYRQMGAELIFKPWQQAAGNYRLYYVARPEPLVDDADEVPDAIDMWSEFIEIFAALKAQGKEETDTGELGMQLGLIRADIEVQASMRDASEPDTVAVVESESPPWPFQR